MTEQTTAASDRAYFQIIRTNLRLAFIIIGALLMLALALTAQAETYTGATTPAFSKVFQPDTIGPGSTSTLRFDIVNDTPSPVTDLAFTDTLPAGVVIADPASVTTNCSGALVSAPAGGSTISMSGGRLGRGQSCHITVNVVSTTPGTHMNVSGDLTSSAGNSGPATDDLTVDETRPGFSKSFSPSTISLGQTSTLTFLVDNTANSLAVIDMEFSDTLPSGMRIASPANVTTDCGTSPDRGFISAESGSRSITFFYFGTTMFPAVAAGSVCTFSVDVTTDANGVFVNTSGELLTGTSNLSSGLATDALNVPVEFLAKSFLNDPVVPGSTVDLRFNIQNPSRKAAATDISFDDNLPAGLTFNSLLTNTCGGTLDTSTPSVLSFSGGTLAPGGSCLMIVRLNVPAATAAGEYVNTTSAVTATIDGDTVTGNMATDRLRVRVIPVFTKMFTDDPSGAGGQVTLEFTITNTDPTSGLENMDFTDDLSSAIEGLAANDLVAMNGLDPAPVDDVCGMGSRLTVFDFNDTSPGFPVNVPPDPTLLIFTGGNLAPAGSPGDSCTFSVVLDIPGGVTSGVYTNTTGDLTGDFTARSESFTAPPASDGLTIVGAPRLTKSFTDDPVAPGDTVTLEFTLTHSAEATGDATGVLFTDDLSSMGISGLTATGLPQADICGPGNGTLSGSAGDTFLTAGEITLQPGQVCTFSVTLQVPANAPDGTFTNTTSEVSATVGGVMTTGSPASDDLRVGGVRLTKEFTDDPVIPGDTVNLLFTIDNLNNTETATNISFTDDLDAVLPGLVVTGMTVNPCGGTFSGTTELSFSGGTLGPGASCTFSATLQVPAGAEDGRYNNVTSPVTANIGGSPFTGDSARDDLTVRSDLLLLTKSFTDDPVAPGGTVTLEFTLTNSSSTGAASGIAFSDDLDAVVPGLAATTPLPLAACGGTVSSPDGGQTIDFSGGSLGISGTCSFSLTLAVPSSAAPDSVYLNTTSQVTGTISGLPVNGAPATDELNTVSVDTTPPTIIYTPFGHTDSTAGRDLAVSISDETQVQSASIFYSVNGGAFTSNACTLSSGTTRNGTWNCPISGPLPDPSAVAYYVSATDTASNTATNPAGGASAPNLFTVGAATIPGGTYAIISVGGGVNLGGNVTVTQNLSLGGIVNAGPHILTIGCSGVVTGAGSAAYVIGTVAKQFCAASSFSYPVGTPAGGRAQSFGAPSSGYSPFFANVTAVGAVPSTLSVSVTDGFFMGVSPDQTASRYWDVTETGDITADISFTYLDEDVNGDESQYKVLRNEGTVTEVYPGGTVDPATNTATAPGVTEFSKWAAGNLGPSAAGVLIGGRVLSPSGRGIYGARVFLTDDDGNVISARTNPFGYYRFADVGAGRSYVITAEHKSWDFGSSARVLSVRQEDLSVDIVARGRN